MADKKETLGAAEVRRVETTTGETGVGQSDRTDVTYELGFERDGAWTPFASVSESRADMFTARHEAEQAKADAEKAKAKPSGA